MGQIKCMILDWILDQEDGIAMEDILKNYLLENKSILNLFSV